MNESADKAIEAAQTVKLVVMDVDGTLTDSAMFYSASGEELKRFSARDGMGITLLHKAGIRTAIITSENSMIVERRAEKLGIEDVVLGCRNKSDALVLLCHRLGTPLDQVAYIGDDINDVPVMGLCGLSGCPADAVDAVRIVSAYHCQATGGNGAVREFAEYILRAQGKSVTLQENW
jgi:3-deoxy-D-manno-octulosonate 8-phosphate phosphatase (KDO 8-P phosphatase)